MNLTPMRFKNYIWPHNPTTFRVQYRRNVAVQEVPFGGFCTEDLGAVCRVMEGEGEFSGTHAYRNFKELAAVFADPGPGLLVHPVCQTISAYFVSLQLTEQPLPNYVRYTFAFWENGEAPTPTVHLTENVEQTTRKEESLEETIYRVKRGDTLWHIARRFHMTLSDLIALNPQIKNPNLIHPGERVTVR